MKCDPPSPALSESTTATAVTASPFQTLRATLRSRGPGGTSAQCCTPPPASTTCDVQTLNIALCFVFMGRLLSTQSTERQSSRKIILI